MHDKKGLSHQCLTGINLSIFFQFWRDFWRGIISIPTKTYLPITHKSLLNQRKNFIFIL